MRHLLLLLLALTVANPASAKCVVIVGDSISSTLEDNTHWPARLKALRPDVTTCNISAPGKTTFDAYTQFDGTMAWITQTHEVTDVIILLGINDFSMYCSTSFTTANKLRGIAAKVRAWGAREWIMTPTPASGGSTCLGVTRQEFTNGVGTELHTLNGVGPDEYVVMDLRDEYARYQAWTYPTCTGDGVHPTALCRQYIANFVASWLPQQ